MEQLARPVTPVERHALKRLAVVGGLGSAVKVSCAEIASQLDVSNQTASRRLQALADAGAIDRELQSDGQLIVVTNRGEELLRREYETYRALFEDNETLRIRGDVTAGMGEGRHYISLKGYRTQFLDRLGYEPFPGTLNLVLDQQSIERRSQLAALEAIPIDAWEDEERTYGPANCYAVMVENADGQRYRDAHIIVPERTHHDADNLELIAPDKLRDELDLADGDTLLLDIEGR